MNIKDLFKNKIATTLVVVATVILAAIAIFTAVKLYQLKDESVSPTAPSEPKAWYCDKYVFNVDGNGVVTVRNDSPRSESPQQAVVYINDIQMATFDVPALPQGQSATLGTVEVPLGEVFTWRVVGTIDCSNSGTAGSEPVACKQLLFTITTPSTTPTSTSTPTPTSTPTNTPTPTPPIECNDTCTSDSDCPSSLVCFDEGDESYCRNPSCTSEAGCTCPALSSTPTNTPTPTEPPRGGSSETPTPTQGEIAAASPTPGGSALPDAGISTPTILGVGLGLLVIIFAVILAI